MIDNRLREVRHGAGCGQVELADAVGVTQAYIQQIETGLRPITIPILLMACDKLGCTPNDILGYTAKEGDSDAGRLQT